MTIFKNKPPYFSLPYVVSCYDWTAFEGFGGNFYMKNKEETWKDIPGLCALYQASDMERVRSLDRSAKLTRNGKEIKSRKMKGAILSPYIDHHGYYCVSTNLNGIRKGKKVHRLIALAFIPNPENKPQVNHKNGIKTDNRIENLEWCTSKENVQHAYSCGLNTGKKGNENSQAKLTETNVKEIISFLPHKGNIEISISYSVSASTICDIRKNRTWKHIPRENYE